MTSNRRPRLSALVLALSIALAGTACDRTGQEAAAAESAAATQAKAATADIAVDRTMAEETGPSKVSKPFAIR